jgi:hypothetical protein
LFHRRRAGFRDRDGLARGDGGNDEVGLRGEIGMRRRQRDAVRGSMIAQRSTGLIAAEFDVVGGDLDVLPAQIFGQNAAHFAIADEAYVPISGVGRHHGHSKGLQIYRSPGEGPRGYCF